MFALGQVVFSKYGRDKGKAFIVTAEEGEFIYLVDGRLRTLAKPKKKKAKHVQITYHIDNEIGEKLGLKKYLNDADFRKALRVYDKDYRSLSDNLTDLSGETAEKKGEC